MVSAEHRDTVKDAFCGATKVYQTSGLFWFCEDGTPHSSGGATSAEVVPTVVPLNTTVPTWRDIIGAGVQASVAAIEVEGND